MMKNEANHSALPVRPGLIPRIIVGIVTRARWWWILIFGVIVVAIVWWQTENYVTACALSCLLMLALIGVVALFLLLIAGPPLSESPTIFEELPLTPARRTEIKRQKSKFRRIEKKYRSKSPDKAGEHLRLPCDAALKMLDELEAARVYLDGFTTWDYMLDENGERQLHEDGSHVIQEVYEFQVWVPDDISYATCGDDAATLSTTFLRARLKRLPPEFDLVQLEFHSGVLLDVVIVDKESLE